MSPEEWRRIERVVDQALDLAPAKRAEYLADACGDDCALRSAVEEVLAGASGVGFLDSPAGAYAAPLISGQSADRDADDEPGTQIGPYRVLRELGRGGMGAVVLAERADGQFTQRVALKLIKRGMDSDEIHARFLAERQILARLHHPNIARLLDGGVAADGRQYFAMEYVEGTSITAHCDALRMPVDERLRLFAQACEAVRYAHNALVVHRDLKPSNILVTAAGEAKLLDFGIAKLLRDDPAGLDAHALTQAGMLLLTPDYAAPEQVRGTPVTTATDVYALGAILYELLTGRRAHRFATRTPMEVARVVCDVTPERPSVAVLHAVDDNDSPATAPSNDEIARLRGTEPARLGRRLRGDLDTIVLTALHKDATLRYASTDALLEDLRRYAANEPIRARGESFPYRAQKFLRRHRAGIAAGTALFVTLIAGVASTTWQARVARREAAKATAVKDFVISLFTASDPSESRGRDITARELLARGRLSADTGLAHEPALKAEMLNTLAGIYRELGFYAASDTLFGRAATLAASTYGAESGEVATILTGWGLTLYQSGAYERADSLLTKALAYRKKALNTPGPDAAESMANLAAVVEAKGDLDRAEQLYRNALAISRRYYGERSLKVAEDLSNLGVTLWRGGKLQAADSATRAALEIRRKLQDGEHPQFIISQHNLAGVLLALGKLDEAETLEREVVAKRRHVYPQGHNDVAIALQQLELILEARGRYEEAESTLVEALAVRRKWLGESHPETITLIANIGVLDYRMGHLAEAAAATRQAVDGFQRTLGASHPTTVTTRTNLGVILTEQGAYAEAEPMLRDALTSRRAMFGDSSAVVAQTLRHLGLWYYARHDTGQAESSFRDALRIYRQALPEGHFRTAEALTSLGALLADRGCSAEGEQLLREALAIRVKAHGAGDARTAETERALGVCLEGLRSPEAERHLVASYDALRDNRFAGRQRAETARRLAAYYDGLGRHSDAARIRRDRGSSQ